MGYTTDFYGEIKIEPPILTKHANTINRFADIRHEDNPLKEYGVRTTAWADYYCQWVINSKGNLEWDRGEKFYNYRQWLQYLIDKFFQPWGYKLNGQIEWQGEDHFDRGLIIVKDNRVSFRTTLEYK